MRLRRFTFTPSLHRIPFFILLICERSVWRSLTFENLAGYPNWYMTMLQFSGLGTSSTLTLGFLLSISATARSVPFLDRLIPRALHMTSGGRHPDDRWCRRNTSIAVP